MLAEDAYPSTCASTESDDELNQEQRRVVEHGDGPLVVAAVAGCGKTRAIVHRIAFLVRSGVDEDHILAVTFSTKAAKEMNTRLVQLGVYGARVGTFHSLSWQIVRAERPHLRSWDVDDRDRYRYLVKDALGFRGMNWKSADLTMVLSFITRCKAAAALPGTPLAQELAKQIYSWAPSPQRDPSLMAQAYFEAEELRKSRRILTYDDMLLEAWNVLSGDENARLRWASKWDHVLQDESQDENRVQREIASMLARDHRRYIVVGDPAQAIFGFRGSDPSGMLAFGKVWNAGAVNMARNYRSAKRIVTAANRVLDAMAANTHLGVHIVGVRENEGVVTATRYPSFDEEGQGVVERIQAQHIDGVAWKDIAVLYRTNAQSRGVEEALLSARISYQVIGGTNFYNRKEVRDLLAYARVASGNGTFDDVRRAINTPFRFLGKAFVEGIETASNRATDEMSWTDVVRSHVDGGGRLQGRQRASALEWCALIDEMTASMQRGVDGADHDDVVAARPAQLLEGLIDDIDYSSWLSRDEGTESPENNRVSNVRELIRAAQRFPTMPELLAYIDDTVARAEEMQRTGEAADCVTLTSLHRSKGLEWSVVHMIGANQKILPHARAEDHGEERRLFYVGVTRARDELHISCVCAAAVGPRLMTLEPSQFIDEAGLSVSDHKSCNQPSSVDAFVERSRAQT